MKATQSAEGRASVAGRPRHSRDAERSRAAILDSAQQLFADRGFHGVSLAVIAAGADVSVGLPGYFFGSKAALHHEVLQRVFAHRDEVLESVAADAEELIEDSDDHGEAALRRLLDGYMEFLLANPAFVALLTRDALEHAGNREVQPRHAQRFAERTIRILRQAGVVEAEHNPDHLFLTLVAMCYFPLEHDTTIVAGMGQRAWTDAFQKKRVDHIVRLLLASSIADE